MNARLLIAALFAALTAARALVDPTAAHATFPGTNGWIYVTVSTTIHRFDPATGEGVELGPGTSVSVTADGRTVMFVGHPDGNIWRMDADGANGPPSDADVVAGRRSSSWAGASTARRRTWCSTARTTQRSIERSPVELAAGGITDDLGMPFGGATWTYNDRG